MNSPVVARDVGGFPGKKQCVLNRTRQCLLRAISADFCIAVGPAREWIILPIVKVSMLEQAFQFLRADAQQPIERVKSLFNHKRLILAGKPLRTTKRCPTSNNRQFLRHCGPPSWEPIVLGEKKTHVGQSLGSLTAAF